MFDKSLSVERAFSLIFFYISHLSYTDEFQNKMHQARYSHSHTISQQNILTKTYKNILNCNLFIKCTIVGKNYGLFGLNKHHSFYKINGKAIFWLNWFICKFCYFSFCKKYVQHLENCLVCKNLTSCR